MNAGLGNLISLKRQLLAPSIATQSTFNAQVEAIGKGVAKQLEKYCNRLFERTAGAVDEFTADRDHYWLKRTPIETVTSLEQSTDGATWTASSAIELKWLSNGMVYFGSKLGEAAELGRITYTGGYWWDTTEDEQGSLPTGATAVPDDLVLAWYLQARAVWQQIDRLGKDVAKSPGAGTALGNLVMLDSVKELVGPYRRFQIT